MFEFILYAFLCCLVGAVGRKSGRSMTIWTIISFLITPLFGGILLAIRWLMNGSIIRIPT